MANTLDDDPLFTFTIYDHPKDHPGAIVVRRWRIKADLAVESGVWCFAADIDSARRSLPAGLVCLGRQPDDDPVIVETWI